MACHSASAATVPRTNVNREKHNRLTCSCMDKEACSCMSRPCSSEICCLSTAEPAWAWGMEDPSRTSKQGKSTCYGLDSMGIRSGSAIIKPCPLAACMIRKARPHMIRKARPHMQPQPSPLQHSRCAHMRAHLFGLLPNGL